MADGDQKTGIQDDHGDAGAENDGQKPKAQPDQRENLKQEVKFKGEREDVKSDLNVKKKRRRRRKKKTSQEGVPSVRGEPTQPIEPTPAAFNPFETNLPPSNYEAEKKREDVTATPEDLQVQAAALEQAVKESAVAINPFEPTPQEKPIDQRAFEQKPLERQDNLPSPVSPFDLPKMAPEEIKHAQAESESTQNEESDLTSINADQSEVAAQETPVKENPSENVQEGEVVESEVDPIVEELKQDIENEKEFKEDFWQVLEQAGITKNKLITFAVIIILGIFITLALIFGWFEALYFWRDDGEVQQTSLVEEEEGVIGRGGITGVISSYIFGLEYNSPLQLIEAVPVSSFAKVGGYEAAFVFGQIDDLKKDRFVSYVNLLRKIKSTYETDVYEYVNLAVDRRKALEDFISLVNDLIAEGESALVTLSSQMELLNAQYGLIIEQKDFYETAFFNDSNALLGQSAYDDIQLFIENGKKVVDFRAQYNSASFLFDKMIRYLTALRPRYRDIVANKEAIIQGIKIFDLPESDLNAIVPIE